jgi:hypothetical protein
MSTEKLWRLPGPSVVSRGADMRSQIEQHATLRLPVANPNSWHLNRSPVEKLFPSLEVNHALRGSRSFRLRFGLH